MSIPGNTGRKDVRNGCHSQVCDLGFSEGHASVAHCISEARRCCIGTMLWSASESSTKISCQGTHGEIEKWLAGIGTVQKDTGKTSLEEIIIFRNKTLQKPRLPGADQRAMVRGRETFIL